MKTTLYRWLACSFAALLFLSSPSFAESKDAHDDARKSFLQNPVTAAVYQEYMNLHVAQQRILVSSWGLAKSYPLAEASVELKQINKLYSDSEKLHEAWSVAAKEVLKMPSLTRPETETALKYIAAYRDLNLQINSEIYESKQRLQKKES